MEYILMLGFVGWLFALLSMGPAAPKFKVEETLDLSYAEEAEHVIELPKAA